MKSSAKNIWITTAYLAVIFVMTFLMTVFSVACIAKDFSVFSYYKVYLPLTLMVFGIMTTLYFYIVKFDKNSNEHISVLKRCLICYSMVFIAVVVSCVLYSYFSSNAIVISSVTMMVTVLINKKMGIFSSFVTMGVLLAIVIARVCD